MDVIDVSGFSLGAQIFEVNAAHLNKTRGSYFDSLCVVCVFVWLPLCVSEASLC